MNQQSSDDNSLEAQLDFLGSGAAKDGGTMEPIREKSFSYALDIIQLFTVLKQHREHVFSEQLLRCGTSIGFRVEEAFAADNREDALQSLHQARRNARETIYWLRLLHRSSLFKGLDVMKQLERANELIEMLVAIINKVGPGLRQHDS